MNNIKHCKRILISRTDNIGDVVLTLPIAAVLKQYFPETKIFFLAREYVRDVVNACSDVDVFLSFDQLSQLPLNEVVRLLQSHQLNAVIHVYPKSKIAAWMKQAKIPDRIGSARRLYHWWTCNKRVAFSRAKSKLHEAQLNLKLLAPFGITKNFTTDELRQYIQLQPTNQSLPARLTSCLDANKFNLIIHPLTNGHTREWPLSHFVSLIQQLSKDRVNIIVTGSEKEISKIKLIQSRCDSIVNLAGQCTLNELMRLIACADGLIANSTGPLHLAAALGIRTLGLYSSSPNISPTRWSPIGKQAEVLTADSSNCSSAECRSAGYCLCMKSITVEQVKAVVMRWSDNHIADETFHHPL